MFYNKLGIYKNLKHRLKLNSNFIAYRSREDLLFALKRSKI